MSNVNIAILEGRLTHDPEFKTTQNGKTLCKFSVANNRYYYKDKQFHDNVSFLKTVVWGRLAERCATYLKKGSRILVHGDIRQDRYKSKDGKNRESIYISATEVKFLDRKKNAEARVLRDEPRTLVKEISENTDDSVIPETKAIPF